MGNVTITDQILAANSGFYDAFNARDLDAMRSCWARRDDVSSIPPIGDPAVGWEEVLESFEAGFAHPDAFTLTAEVLSVTFEDPVATVSCTECLQCHGKDAVRHDMLATNVFVLGDEGWLLTHHHASWRSMGHTTRPGAGA